MRPFVAACVVLGALLPSCSDPTPPPRPRGLLPGEEQAAARPIAAPVQPPPPTRPPPPSSLTSPFAKAPDPGALSRPAEPTPTPPPVEDDASVPQPLPRPKQTPPEALGTTPRDLPSELIKLVGKPADCLNLSEIAAAGGRTTLSITASVMPSGRIIRASVSAPDQPADALRCLEDKVNAGNFRSPVPDAPRDVTATIPIEVVAQPEPRPETP